VCRKIVGSLADGGHLVTVNNVVDAPRLQNELVKAGLRLVRQDSFPDPARAYAISVLQK
jgi:hypothetical protein